MRVDLFGVREGGRRSTASCIAPLRPEVPTLRPGKAVPARNGDPHDEAGPSVHAGDGRLQRSLGRRDGHQRRPRDRPQRRHRSGQAATRSIPGRTSSTCSCSTATATASTAAIRRTSSRRSTTTRFRPARRPACTTGCTLPDDVTAPVTVEVKLQYRKFDTEYMQFVAKNGMVGGEPIRGDDTGGSGRTSTSCRSRRWRSIASRSRSKASPPTADQRRSATFRPGSGGTTTASACCSRARPSCGRRRRRFARSRSSSGTTGR